MWYGMNFKGGIAASGKGGSLREDNVLRSKGEAI